MKPQVIGGFPQAEFQFLCLDLGFRLPKNEQISPSLDVGADDTDFRQNRLQHSGVLLNLVQKQINLVEPGRHFFGNPVINSALLLDPRLFFLEFQLCAEKIVLAAELFANRLQFPRQFVDFCNVIKPENVSAGNFGAVQPKITGHNGTVLRLHHGFLSSGRLRAVA